MQGILNKNGGSVDLSKLQSSLLECGRYGNSGNSYPVTQELSLTAKPIVIGLASSCNRWTQANTLNESIIYGSTDNGANYEELGKISWSGTQTLETRIELFFGFSKVYNKFKISTKQGSGSYPSWAKAIIYY